MMNFFFLLNFVASGLGIMEKYATMTAKLLSYKAYSLYQH